METMNIKRLLVSAAQALDTTNDFDDLAAKLRETAKSIPKGSVIVSPEAIEMAQLMNKFVDDVVRRRKPVVSDLHDHPAYGM